MANWHELPEDIVVQILKKLTPRELCTIKTVSWSFRYLASLVYDIAELPLGQVRSEIKSLRGSLVNQMNHAATLQSKLDDLRARLTCRVCLANEVAWAPTPCHHLSLCDWCISTRPAPVSRCPICQGDVSSYVRIVIS